jgi:hydrogenase maturation protein HypF
VPVSSARRDVLAVGGELKSAFCLASTSHAWMSQHLGDMENLETLEAFERCVEQFEQHTAITPQVLAVDRHPGYRTSAWARANRRDLVVEVQHHHAHIASVMAEHGWNPQHPVLGFAFDGTGYGDDGTIWGGEALLADAGGYERIGHLEPIDLPGGDAAITNPCRVALAHLAAAGIAWTDDLAPVGAMTPPELDLLRRQLDRRVACVPTTSMGRLFDAVASLLGLRHEISYEAQAAIEVETVAARAWSKTGGSSLHYRFGVDGARIDMAPVLRLIVQDVRAGTATDEIALAFHEAVADVVLTVARRVRAERAVNTVVLAGGVFQNALLAVRCSSLLEDADFEVLTNRIVPPNDGGLALGQAYLAGHGDPVSRPTRPEV